MQIACERIGVSYPSVLSKRFSSFKSRWAKPAEPATSMRDLITPALATGREGQRVLGARHQSDST